MSHGGYDFTIEYAKSNRSTCKTCKESIAKDSLRLAYMIQAPNFDGKIPVWNHPKCFFAKTNHGLTDWDMLHNNQNVRPNDQTKIVEMIEKNAGGSGGKKRKSAEDDDEEEEEEEKEEKKEKKGGKKQKREETEEEKALKEQTQEIWDLKDKLKKNCRLPDFREILELNDQDSTGGEHRLLERVADGLLFGALPKCPECKEGHLFIHDSGVYKCSGYASSWSKCTYETDTVTRTKWKTKDSSNDFLSSYKTSSPSSKKRILLKKEIKKKEKKEGEEGEGNSLEGESTSSTTTSSSTLFNKVGNDMEEPFEGMIISVTKLDTMPQTEAKKKIEELGATFSTSVTVRVTHLISTEDEVNQGKTKVTNAIKYDIPILSEKYLTETISKKKYLNQLEYLIGGSDEAKREIKYQFTDPKEREEELKKKKEIETGEKKKKLVMKGRAAVDPMSGEETVRDYHVLDLGPDQLFDVVLNMADVTTGINSFYGLQILEKDKDVGGRESKYQLFRKWGRVGTSIGGKKLEPFSSKDSAIIQFEKLYLEKTGNEWDDRKTAPKQPGKFYPIEIDYGQDDFDLETLKSKMASSRSKLDSRVQNIVSLIFDIKLMEESLLEMEIDLKKMPLGKLSKRHIQSGYEALKKIEGVLSDSKLSDKKRKNELLALTNQFYTLIPHDFGTGELKLIDTNDALKDKMKLMEALIDIEIATSLLKSSSGDEGGGESIIDSNYKKLKTELKGLEKEGDKFKLFENYVKNQAGSFNLNVEDILEVKREGEKDRFDTKKSLGNRMLLWHGSRLTNYVGILSQGLRIAPPEAPKSGYRFGKGVYFADLCEKSAHYCRAKGSDYLLMMLCEVALGTTKELLRDQYMEQPLPGSNSTKAMGAIAPEQNSILKENEEDVDGIIVPFGKPKNTGIKSSCQHNEYIIYDVSQVRIRYLLKLKISDKK